MRLVIIILIGCFMQVSAASFGQKVTLIEKNATVAQLLKKIKEQTGYDVLYKDKVLDHTLKITINATNVQLSEALDQIFENQSLSYTISDQTIVVKEKEKPSIVQRIVDYFQSIEVKGIVRDHNGNPLSGATVIVKGADKQTTTNEKGEFSLLGVDEQAILIINFIGFKTKELPVSKIFMEIKMEEGVSNLAEVSIVSTGFQEIPKERATGSFVQIDNGLLNRSVSTNILDRLNGVTSGLIFSSAPALKQSGQSSIEIHGRSTLFANAEPLIILDNFPYEGDLNNINPNDIESITLLKDAAAASAWGTRSGNGVIVITTKKGKFNAAPTVGFSANTTIGERPDLYYTPQLSSSEFIDVQQFLYGKGAYNNDINNGYSILSPAVEIFRNPTDPNYQSKLDALKTYDLRDQLTKYFYRPSLNQQYQANISGGSNSQKYFVSAGYDRNLASNVGNSYDRINLNASNTYTFLKNKLELFSNIIYTGSKSIAGQSYTFSNPYDQIADENGSPLVVANTLRLSYAQTAGNGKLLNWLYSPLDELNNNYNATNTDLTSYRINLSLSYKILDGLKAALFYNYEKGVSGRSTLYDIDSFYTRNLINRFTQINETTAAVFHPLPVGAIYYDQTTNSQSHNGRFQLNYDKAWNKHNFSGIAGAEIRQFKTTELHNQFYGYNSETGSNQNGAIDFTADNPFFYGSATDRLTPNDGTSGTIDRFISYYFNGSYTYNNKYIASVSVREDESNLFGVSTNQKGVPLWSAGLAWILNKEPFYNLKWLPQLKLRATYGYTGNVDNSLSAILTSRANSQQINAYNTIYGVIVNPPNPSLRWEKVRNINLGLDFSSMVNRISGSVDFWQKKGIDLIGNSPIAPQTGIVIYTGNSANTMTKGIDIQLNTVNLNGAFKWYTTFLYNYIQSEVTSYKVSNGTNFNVVSANYNNPLEGYPYFSIFSYKYAGLNATGNPQGYLNGELSTNYSGIANSTSREELIFNGSAVPTNFGNLRNSFSFKNIDLSFNISYKLGYYFRRSSLNNTALYSSLYRVADYGKQWQKPGDEQITNVPALIYPTSSQRDALYTYSEVLVQKADHIRFQDVRLGYTFSKRALPLFKNLNIFAYVNNVGILWRANKYHLDPDYPTGIPVTRTISFGLKTNL